MTEQKVLLKESDYKRLIKLLEIYKSKLNEINGISSDFAQFNPNYERIRKISEIE